MSEVLTVCIGVIMAWSGAALIYFTALLLWAVAKLSVGKGLWEDQVETLSRGKFAHAGFAIAGVTFGLSLLLFERFVP